MLHLQALGSERGRQKCHLWYAQHSQFVPLSQRHCFPGRIEQPPQLQEPEQVFWAQTSQPLWVVAPGVQTP